MALKKVGGVAALLLYNFRRTSLRFEMPSMCMQFVAARPSELSSVTPAGIETLASRLAWVHGRRADDLVEGPPTRATYCRMQKGGCGRSSRRLFGLMTLFPPRSKLA